MKLALVPLSTLRDALQVAELAWQIEAAGDAGETLNGLAFNVLPKLRALLPPGPLKHGEREAEEDDFKAQLKRISSPAAGALREGAGESVKASGLTAEGYEAACGRSVVFHLHRGDSAGFLGDTDGLRRFWLMGEEGQSSGLAAVGVEASATSTTPTAAADDATKGEPGAAAC
ncbi:hypothetical protein ACG02S_07945 [Roseateles sp. DC23W]|uniref:Uncharacterized protein n=1 Tax=Pelomonas dachongensis TaxID=3299029 RepID=A0ABW7EK29_9BURK